MWISLQQFPPLPTFTTPNTTVSASLPQPHVFVSTPSALPSTPLASTAPVSAAFLMRGISSGGYPTATVKVWRNSLSLVNQNALNYFWPYLLSCFAVLPWSQHCHGTHMLNLFQSSPTPLWLPLSHLHPSTPTPMYTCMPALCMPSQTIAAWLCMALEEAPMLQNQKVVPLLNLSDVLFIGNDR